MELISGDPYADDILVARQLLANSTVSAVTTATVNLTLLSRLLGALGSRDDEIDRLSKLVEEKDSLLTDCEGEINAADRDMQEMRARIGRMQSVLDARDRDLDNLRAQLRIAESFHKVAVAERDLERARNDSLAQRHSQLLNTVNGQQFGEGA